MARTSLHALGPRVPLHERGARAIANSVGASIAIVGAGAVGLATAAALARSGHAVYVLERNGRIGQEISSRNSEVIHAGIYYPTGSLKARSCVEGRRLLLDWAVQRGIPHRLVGKIVVATSEQQLDALRALRDRGVANGTGGLRLLDADEVRIKEPRVRSVAGLWSPETGVLDSHAYMDSLKREAADHGAYFVMHTEVIGFEQRPEGLALATTNSRGESSELVVDWVVNAAGLASDRIAELSGIDVHARKLKLYPCKGDYFALAGKFKGTINHLVYPMPEAAGLGVHLTMDLTGSLRAGPDATYMDAPSYSIDEGKAESFAHAVGRYLPGVTPSDFAADYAGVRPKLQGPGEAFRDFVCEVLPEASRVVQLIGIESPGLTASLALAREVERLVAGA